MPTYTSDSRTEAYEYLRFLSRHKMITSAQFKHEKAKIDKREAKSVAHYEAKRAAAATRAAAALAARKAATVLRRAAAKEAKKIPQNLLQYSVVVDEIIEATVRSIWKRAIGSRVRILSSAPANRDAGKPPTYFDMTITAYPKDEGYVEFRRHFFHGSDGDSALFTGEKLYVMSPNNVEPKRIAQRFRDGINHCVFTPLFKKLAASVEGASDSTKKRLNQKIRKLQGLKDIYEDGVPEDKMEEVAKAAGIKIALFDVLGSELAVYNKDGRGGCLQLTNTRENHVDYGMVVESDPCKVSHGEMVKLWHKMKQSREFYMIDGDLRSGEPTKIRTLEGAWAVKDPLREACADFDKQLGIMNYKIDAMKNRPLNDFLKAGRIVNGWSTTFSDAEATGCADMPAAYAQFKNCAYYMGFLGHIHQFRSGSFDRPFVEVHLGYYEVVITGGVSWLMRSLGMTEGMKVVLFSPELLYFMDDGLEVDIVQGAFGSRFDFDFPPEMMIDRRYCFWAGRLGIEREETSHTISASSEWASHLAVDHKVYYWKEEALLTIKKPVKKCFTAHHILGALTSYVRIQMMDAMKMFRPENLVRVVLDGIYYRGEKPSGLEWFKDKGVKAATCDSLPWYVDGEREQFPPLGRIVQDSLLTGQGGSGKTYSVFNDPGFNEVLFVAPSHLLGQDVHFRYKAKYTTIHKLIGIECRPYYEEHRVPSVILVDEITQVDAEWVDKVFEMYPESLILLAGDIDAEGRWYQCRSGSGKEWSKIWKPVGVDVIEFLEDRRSRDDDLKALKLHIRRAMKQCELDYAPEVQMQVWAKRFLPVSAFDSAKFQPGDTCIAGTHRTNARLLEMGVVSGWYKKGGYVSAVEMPGYEKRGSYSVHSYQGKTIEAGNVWVFVDDIFEYAMLYTAVSRAVNMSQIKFVRF